MTTPNPDPLSQIQAQLLDLTRAVGRRRKIPTPFVKQLHFQVVHFRRNGFCPCCQEVRILDECQQLIGGAELDHWYSPNRNGPEEMWLVCRSCNMLLTRPSYKASKTSAFFAYQQVVRVFLDKGRQQQLF